MKKIIIKTLAVFSLIFGLIFTVTIIKGVFDIILTFIANTTAGPNPEFSGGLMGGIVAQLVIAILTYGLFTFGIKHLFRRGKEKNTGAE